jgi:pimeloyl-ACP methyl ester carboxylesterase
MDIELNGVRTWYDEHNDGDPLVLMHPAGADNEAWAPQLDALRNFHLYLPERRGHGRTRGTDEPLSHELMAQDTIAFLEKVSGPAHLVGCSDGATTALVTTLRRPDLVHKLVLVCGVFHHQGWGPGVIPPVEETEGLLRRLTTMHQWSPALTEQDLKTIPNRTLIMVGDDDEVQLEHATAMYRGLPNAELAVVPGTSHGLLWEKPALCNAMIIDFLENDPVRTIAPIRRL